MGRRVALLGPVVTALALLATFLTPLQSAFAAAPTITSFSPTSGGFGTRVVITGTNFSGSEGCVVNRVRFGVTDAASYVVDSATQITATVSTGKTGDVSVRTAGGTGCATAIAAGTFTWTATTFTVTYSGNGSTSGMAPVDGTTPYASGSTVTVLGNTGSLAKIGYAFLNWNTAADGSGTSYAPGATFAIGANTILYAQWVITYTVTYNGNGKTGGSSPTVESVPYVDGATVTVLGNTGSLVRTGNTFDNWNTAADGSGTQYAPDDTFVIHANTILYAQWRAAITYDGNGATSGSVPIDGSSPYLNGATVTVAGNTGSLAKTGSTFVNWNTAADGSGISYLAGGTFAIGADTVLYAQWTAITYTLTYNGNGSNSGSVPVDGSSPYATGTTVTVLGNTGSLAKIGYAFLSWNTLANGSGTSYAPGATFAIGADTILYAQWAAVYSLIYDEDGSTGGSVPVDTSSPYVSGSTVTVLDNTGSLTKTGYVFSHWNTAFNGSGTSYAPGGTFVIESNTVLYPQWTLTGSYTVTYNGNGATGGSVPVDGSSPYASGSTVTVLGNTGSLTRTGYTFSHWHTAADGSGTSYAPGDTFVIGTNITFYADWAPTGTYTITYNGNGATGGSVPVDGSSPYASGSTVTVLGNTGSLTRTGYGFSHWNTALDGSGTSYTPAATFTIGANTILYAQWTFVGSYVVIYDEDGSTGGSVPVDTSSPYVSGSTVTVLGNTGLLVRTGTTFIGWNTALDGSGTFYAPGATFVITACTILYPQWRAAITYDGNGATGGSVPVDASSPYLTETAVTVLGNTGSLTRTGYVFSHWNTSGDDTGTSYLAGDAFAITADTVLYAQWAVITFTVTYDGSGATGGSVPVDGLSPYASGSAVIVLGNTGSLTKPGYVFSHWNTALDGSGISYMPAATFTIGTNTILYAQWTTTYTVTYRPAGSTGGTVPVEGPIIYLDGATVTLLGNTGSLVRAGTTFDNWNTAVDGSGISYAPGDTFVIHANVLIFAMWRSTVVYNGNGSTGGSAPVDGSSPYLTPYINYPIVTVLGNTGSLVRTGYIFAHWNTAADGSGHAFSPGDIFLLPASTTLYAQWSLVGTHIVAYADNGATGGSDTVDPSSPYLSGATVTVLGNTGSLVKTGYTFDGWNTEGDGSGTSYAPGATFTVTANTILYARWVLPSYTVTFDGNGNTGGATASQTSNAPMELIANGFTRDGYLFVGWNTLSDGGGTAYANGATYEFASTITLYAQWAINPGRVPYTPPGPPIATAETPITSLVDPTVESVVEASILSNAASNPVVTITVPAGAVSTDVTISITSAVTSVEASAGLISINVRATNSQGALITHFAKPLTLNLGKVATDATVVYSQDGLVWTPIKLLTGTTLPESAHEGFYLTPSGNLMILTDHLTYFGVKRAQAPLFLYSNASRIPLGAFAAVHTTGGSSRDTGAYLTSTPMVCTVDKHGLVTGLKIGTCTVLAMKVGDGAYLNVSTMPLDLTFIDLVPHLPPTVTKTVTVSSTTLFKLIKVNLGVSNGGKKITIQIRKARTTEYKTLCVVTLNRSGVVRTTRPVPIGSTIRVLINGRSQAATVVG